MIIGRDLITSLQLDVKGSDMSIKWNDAAIPWRNIDSTVKDIYLAEDNTTKWNDTDRPCDLCHLSVLFLFSFRMFALEIATIHV